jgi:hypothetical protein
MAVATFGSGADAWSRRAPLGYKKRRSSLSSAPVQPSLWLRRLSSSCRRECVNVSSVPSATARSLISTSDSPGSSAPPSSANSCSAARASRLRDIRRCSHARFHRACGSVPGSGRQLGVGFRHEHGAGVGAPPAGDALRVVSASKTIDGGALIRRTSVRLVIVFSSSLRLPCFPHRPPVDRRLFDKKRS